MNVFIYFFIFFACYCGYYFCRDNISVLGRARADIARRVTFARPKRVEPRVFSFGRASGFCRVRGHGRQKHRAHLPEGAEFRRTAGRSIDRFGDRLQSRYRIRFEGEHE